MPGWSLLRLDPLPWPNAGELTFRLDAGAESAVLLDRARLRWTDSS